MNSFVTEMLVHLGACADAQKWVSTQPSITAAWLNCERGDWMLWLLGRLSGEPESDARRRLVACAADCAATALPLIQSEADRAEAEACIEACRRWSRGEATIEELRGARKAASDAAAAAAVTAYTASDAAAAASDAAAYAADAWREARAKALRECADIVRKHYPTAPLLMEVR